MNFSFFYIRFDKYVFVQVIKVNTFAFSDVEKMCVCRIVLKLSKVIN